MEEEKKESSDKPSARPKPIAQSSNTGRGGLVTMDSIRSKSDSDDEDKQAFYAGGPSSGQQVLGPAGSADKRNELVAEMFQKAKEHGAEEVAIGPGGPGRLKKGSGSGSLFAGTGYKLGESSGAGAEVIPAPPPEPGTRQVVLRLWSRGFTINDGPLREYQVPSNAEFLRDVKEGQIPRELIRDNMGFELDVTMEDRHHEDYVPPKATTRPFFGQGNVLGSPAPFSSNAEAVGSTSAEDRSANEVAARSLLAFRENEPATNIQLRLADGTRLAVRVNYSHTINDLHNFINTARPQYSSSNYTLTLFPSTELTNKDQTIKDANLLNSALIQKLK